MNGAYNSCCRGYLRLFQMRLSRDWGVYAIQAENLKLLKNPLRDKLLYNGH